MLFLLLIGARFLDRRQVRVLPLELRPEREGRALRPPRLRL